MPVPSPVVANWELARRLRTRREQQGLNVNDMAARLGFTRNYWSAIENERKPIPVETLISVFDILEFDNDDRQQLLKLRAAGKRSGWWDEDSDLLENDLKRLLGLEHGAQRIREYESLLIPGLLQTVSYARAIVHADDATHQAEAQQRVKACLRRQERLRCDDPPELKVIINEAALCQQIGGVTVLREQLGHLLTTIEKQQNIEIRISPFTATPRNLFGAGTLLLLDFYSSQLPTVAWLKSATTRTIITDADQVRDITMAFNEAFDHALERRETKKMIENYRKDIR